MKVRIGAGGANLKTISALHVRTAAGAGGLKTFANAQVRIGAGGANLKDFWTPGGGGGGGGGGGTDPIVITPSGKTTVSATDASNTSDFTASFSSAPTSIVWDILTPVSGVGVIISGQGTPTVRVTLTASSPNVQARCSVRCTAVIGGSSNALSVLKRHTYTP
jgi:hypothetical protein